jgi:Uma2 family endonuclease
MSLLQSQLVRYTVDEYLALERESEERHEYLDGEIYAMAGETPDHGRICTNLVIELGSQLRGASCEVFSKDMKVRSGSAPNPLRPLKGLYSYPDVLVVCGGMQFHDEYRDVLLNPTIIIEVLSPATEAFDRGEKWLRYQSWLPSLMDYLLVSQSEPLIERYRRQLDGGWLYSLVSGLEGRVTLASIGCAWQLADVYDRIVFPAEQPETSGEA